MPLQLGNAYWLGVPAAFVHTLKRLESRAPRPLAREISLPSPDETVSVYPTERGKDYNHSRFSALRLRRLQIRLNLH